mmetsp:Transcript_62440/g.136611  ORF Transcript_62440/g.136611 Transcript_62440/m.136611 type:complete len:118 (+) Transcript_62440:1247-1600(+)
MPCQSQSSNRRTRDTSDLVPGDVAYAMIGGSKPWTSVWYQLTVLIGAKNVQDRGKSVVGHFGYLLLNCRQNDRHGACRSTLKRLSPYCGQNGQKRRFWRSVVGNFLTASVASAFLCC